MGEEYIALDRDLSPDDGTYGDISAREIGMEEAASSEHTELEASQEELSDTEYAELIGEEEVSDTGDEAVTESVERPAFENHANENRKKRRKSKGKQSASENNSQMDDDQEKRQIHAIGGADTLKTSASRSNSSQIDEAKTDTGKMKISGLKEITGQTNISTEISEQIKDSGQTGIQVQEKISTEISGWSRIPEEPPTSRGSLITDKTGSIKETAWVGQESRWSPEIREITSDALKSSVIAGIDGTKTREGFYKNCIILPHEESVPYDSHLDTDVKQKPTLDRETRDKGEESFHKPTDTLLTDSAKSTGNGQNTDDTRESALNQKQREKGNGSEEEPRHYENREVLPTSDQNRLLYQSASEIAEKSKRRFSLHRPTTIIRDMERGGRSFSHALRSFTSGQDTAEQAGERSLRKYLGGAVDVVDLLAVLGGKATADIQKEHSRAFREGAKNMERALESGKLKQSDLLLSKKELREKIRRSGLKPYESMGIVKNRSAIHDALVTKEVLLKLKDAYSDQKYVFARTKVLGRNVIGISAHESRKQVGILTSDTGKFYNDYKYNAWTANMIRAYFAAQPDPLFKKLNPVSMRTREIKALIANAEHYHLSAEQVSVLRVLLMGRKAQKNRAMNRYLSGPGGIFRSVKALGRKGVRLFERMDDVSAEGYRKLATIYHGVRTVKPMVKLAGTAGITAVQTVGNLPPVAYARHQAARQIRRGVRALSSAAAVQWKRAGIAVRSNASSLRKSPGGRVRTEEKAAVKGTAGVGGLFNQTAKGSMSSVGTAPFLKTVGDAVKTIDSAKKSAQKGFRRIRCSRPVRVAGYVGGRLQQGAYLVTMPVRAALSGIAHIREGIRKILAAVLVMIFAVLLIFILLLLFAAFITTIGNSTGEIIGGMVTDEELAEHIRHLNDRNEQRFREAVRIAKEAPRHDADRIDTLGLYPDEAYHGVHLYHYGSPKTPDAEDANIYHNDIPGTPPAGYHYYYIDANGETIANHTANTKDIICLTSVMVGNDYDEDALTAAPELMDLWFDHLNPEPGYTVSPLYHREGTDRFPYAGYTFKGQTWYCTDRSFYEAFDSAEADHVHFYDRPAEYSEKGCRTDWDSYDAAREEWSALRPEYPDYPDYDDYEDDEDWQEAMDDYYDAVDAYWEAYGTWSSARPQLSDYRYCPGHDALSCSYGYRDINIYVTVLTKEDLYRAAENGNVLTYRVPKDYACSEWDERSVALTIPEAYEGVTGQFTRDGGFGNPKYQEWCDRLYSGDWYSMYGVDTYSDGVSLPTGEGALSQEQIDEMLARIGDVSEARQAILNFALDYVGRIPYYWGGKASAPGFEGNHFGSTVEADYKGRTRKGLDCSGFVGWVYWSVIGVKPSPAMSTSDIVPSLHLHRISFTDLKPGDIGMEDLPGASSNHIGYFAGFDENGRAKWAHCSSGAGGVTVNTTNCFRYYYRLFED